MRNFRFLEKMELRDPNSKYMTSKVPLSSFSRKEIVSFDEEKEESISLINASTMKSITLFLDQ